MGSDKWGDEPHLRAWDDSRLSALLADADYNTRVTALNFPAIYRLLQRAHETFLKVGEAIEKDDRHERDVPRFLIVRTHASVFAAIRLAMGGQAAESYPVIRAVIEQAWYALHIAKDPEPPSRAEVWWGRNDTEEVTSRCKQEFTVARVRATHAALDVATANQLQFLYEHAIDFGAHPNQRGLSMGLEKSETQGATIFSIPILRAEGLAVPAALYGTVAVAVGALKVFALIFPERFRLAGLDAEIDDLKEGLNTVFKPYARPVER